MTKSSFARYIFLQIIFWTMAYIALGIIVLLLLNSLSNSPQISIWSTLISATLLGFSQGTTFAIVERFSENRFFRRQPLGLIVLYKAFLYFLTTIIILSLFRNFIYNGIISILFIDARIENINSWKYIFYLTLLYNFGMSLIISFVEQVNKKMGSGMMLPLLTGKYRIPKEENRIFLFMDLKSSTTIAEDLGHIKYSAFIRDCFLDINFIASKHKGEIYQYVGDEVVLSWKVSDSISDFSCVDFFFSTQLQFKNRAHFYYTQYGIKPVFKAGAHLGMVTAVEVGEVKREIAFHGDTLNTAARLQSLCREHGESFLISADLAQHIQQSAYTFLPLGSTRLRGKSMSTEIFAVR